MVNCSRMVNGQYQYLAQLLKQLTNIDSVGIEPAFNDRSGIIEPHIVAQKNITEQFQIIGKNSLSGSSNAESSITADYQLSPSLSLTGGFESANSQEESASLIDLTYTILSKQKPFIPQVGPRYKKEIGFATICQQLSLDLGA